jgi:hypothetical protein
MKSFEAIRTKAVKRLFLVISMMIMVTAPAVSAFAIPYDGSSGFLSIGGTPIIAIDGDRDRNVTVNILSTGFTGDYSYGYFKNGESTFHLFPSIFDISIGINGIRGGSILDFALYDGTRYYTLSGDEADSSYSVQMVFSGQVTWGSPEEPSDWVDPYYLNANITWYLADTINTNELAINLRNNNDGLAPVRGTVPGSSVPVPEPSSLILLGSGLAGLGLWGRKRFERS